MKIILDIKLKGNHVSVESFLAAYKLTRSLVVREVSDVVAEEFRLVSDVSKNRLYKYFQKNLCFEVKESQVGSFTLLAISLSVVYLVARISEKLLVEILKDNEDFKDLKKIINDRLSEKLFKRLRKKLEGQKSRDRKFSVEKNDQDSLVVSMTQEKKNGHKLLTDDEVDKAIAEMEAKVKDAKRIRK